jgi:hypothetical protein
MTIYHRFLQNHPLPEFSSCEIIPYSFDGLDDDWPVLGGFYPQTDKGSRLIEKQSQGYCPHPQIPEAVIASPKF